MKNLFSFCWSTVKNILKYIQRNRSSLPLRGLGPAPSPCLPLADHFVFPRPKVTNWPFYMSIMLKFRPSVSCLIFAIPSNTSGNVGVERRDPWQMFAQLSESNIRFEIITTAVSCLFEQVPLIHLGAKSADKFQNPASRLMTIDLTRYFNFNSMESGVLVKLDTLIATQPHVTDEPSPTLSVPWCSSCLPGYPPGWFYLVLLVKQ